MVASISSAEAAIIDALSILPVLVPRDDFRDDCADFLGDDADFVLAGRLQVIRNAAKLFDFVERSVQSLNVVLPPARTIRVPSVADGMTRSQRNGENIRRRRGSDANFHSKRARAAEHEAVAFAHHLRLAPIAVAFVRLGEAASGPALYPKAEL